MNRNQHVFILLFIGMVFMAVFALLPKDKGYNAYYIVITFCDEREPVVATTYQITPPSNYSILTYQNSIYVYDFDKNPYRYVNVCNINVLATYKNKLNDKS